MRGGSVCSTHGGRAPQVRRKAAERLAESADSVMAALITIALNEKVKTADRIMACRDLLDRAGYGATKRIEADIDVEVSSAEYGDMVDAARARLRRDRDSPVGLPGPQTAADGMDEVVDVEVVDDEDGYIDTELEAFEV